MGSYCNKEESSAPSIQKLLQDSYLVLTTIVLIIQLLSILLGVTLSLLAVDVVGTLGLGEPVDFGAGETGKQFLCELVRDGLACRQK